MTPPLLGHTLNDTGDIAQKKHSLRCWMLGYFNNHQIVNPSQMAHDTFTDSIYIQCQY